MHTSHPAPSHPEATQQCLLRQPAVQSITATPPQSNRSPWAARMRARRRTLHASPLSPPALRRGAAAQAALALTAAAPSAAAAAGQCGPFVRPPATAGPPRAWGGSPSPHTTCDEQMGSRGAARGLQRLAAGTRGAAAAVAGVSCSGCLCTRAAARADSAQTQLCNAAHASPDRWFVVLVSQQQHMLRRLVQLQHARAQRRLHAGSCTKHHVSVTGVRKLSPLREQAAAAVAAAAAAAPTAAAAPRTSISACATPCRRSSGTTHLHTWHTHSHALSETCIVHAPRAAPPERVCATRALSVRRVQRLPSERGPTCL